MLRGDQAERDGGPWRDGCAASEVLVSFILLYFSDGRGGGGQAASTPVPSRQGCPCAPEILCPDTGFPQGSVLVHSRDALIVSVSHLGWEHLRRADAVHRGLHTTHTAVHGCPCTHTGSLTLAHTGPRTPRTHMLPPHRHTPACSHAHTCTHAHLSICSHAPTHVSDTHLHAHMLTRAHRPMYTVCSRAPTHTSDTHPHAHMRTQALNNMYQYAHMLPLTHQIHTCKHTHSIYSHAQMYGMHTHSHTPHSHKLKLTPTHACTRPHLHSHLVLSCTHVHARRPSAARLAPGAGGHPRDFLNNVCRFVPSAQGCLRSSSSDSFYHLFPFRPLLFPGSPLSRGPRTRGWGRGDWAPGEAGQQRCSRRPPRNMLLWVGDEGDGKRGLQAKRKSLFTALDVSCPTFHLSSDTC